MHFKKISISILLLTLNFNAVYAAPNKVTVALPSYKTTLNKQVQSKQLQPQKLNLPRMKAVYHQPQLIDGYIYWANYEKTKKGMYKLSYYRASLKAPQNAKLIHTFDVPDLRTTSFYKIGSDVFFSFYAGGATMGSNHQYKITSPGTAKESVKEVASGKMEFTPFEKGKIWVNYFTPPSPGNLSIERNAQKSIPLGNPNFIYGWAKTDDVGFTAAPALIDGQFLYINASDFKDSAQDGFLCKINVDTDKSEVVLNCPVLQLAVEKERLLFINAKTQKLYSKNRATGEEALLSEHTFDHFDRIGQDIFYQNKADGVLYVLDSKNIIKPLLSKYKVSYYVPSQKHLVLKLAEGEAYGLIVADPAGNIIFKTPDKVSNFSISGNTLLYSTEKTHNTYTVTLP